ncbi:uncharacterized protein LOC114479345 [Gouania willdenowi]|uniref:uncharacterized protein LOC114479345 n=1 Tax=Gouania willdenowi TaxID=441366 RepID=UPI001056CB9B|nr:uncharacterized protein LOC114479345 [Gouania willdenowi]
MSVDGSMSVICGQLSNRLGSSRCAADLVPPSVVSRAADQSVTIEVTEQETKTPKKTIIIEETITTVVKNPRSRRHRSPGLLLSGAQRSEASTPEPRQRRTPVPRKTPVPTLYVTESVGVAEGRPRWVEVEEVIEYKVNKSPRLSRRRGVSPAGSDRAVTPSRAKRASVENPNANNSNNKQVKDAPVSAGDGEELQHQETLISTLDDDDDDDEEVRPVVLKEGDRILTLEDLEDYVPGEGEAYRSLDTRDHEDDDRPPEISVLQREVGGSSVGRPVLLNVGRPLATPRHPTGFFRSFREHVSSPPRTSSSSRAERQVPIHVEGRLSYCSELQREGGGQGSFTTTVSTHTRGYGSVGQPVTLQVKGNLPHPHNQ